MIAPKMITINIRGEFNKKELAELLQKVRDVEQRKEGTVHVLIDGPSLTVEEVVEIADGVKPPLPYKKVFRLSGGKNEVMTEYKTLEQQIQELWASRELEVVEETFEAVGAGKFKWTIIARRKGEAEKGG